MEIINSEKITPKSFIINVLMKNKLNDFFPSYNIGCFLLTRSFESPDLFNEIKLHRSAIDSITRNHVAFIFFNNESQKIIYDYNIYNYRAKELILEGMEFTTPVTIKNQHSIRSGEPNKIAFMQSVNSATDTLIDEYELNDFDIPSLLFVNTKNYKEYEVFKLSQNQPFEDAYFQILKPLSQIIRFWEKYMPEISDEILLLEIEKAEANIKKLKAEIEEYIVIFAEEMGSIIRREGKMFSKGHDKQILKIYSESPYKGKVFDDFSIERNKVLFQTFINISTYPKHKKEVLRVNLKEILNSLKSIELIKITLMENKSKREKINSKPQIDFGWVLEIVKKSTQKCIPFEIITGFKQSFSEEFKGADDNNKGILKILDHIKNNLETVLFEQNDIKNMVSSLKISLDEVNKIIKDFNDDQILALKKIISSIEKIDDQKIKKDWNELNLNKISGELLRDLTGKQISSKASSEMKETIDNVEISVKHKLKLIIPLLLLKYEIEFEINGKEKWPTTWAKFKKLFINSN